MITFIYCLNMTTAMKLFIPEIAVAIKRHEDMGETVRDALNITNLLT
jgi:hypothetical protein